MTSGSRQPWDGMGSRLALWLTRGRRARLNANRRNSLLRHLSQLCQRGGQRLEAP